MTATIECLECGALIAVDATQVDESVLCPVCGNMVLIHRRAAAGDVIDVRAEVLGETQSPPEATPPAYSTQGPEGARPGGGGTYVRRTRRHYQDDSGCCLGIGCALVFLLCFLLMRGCLAVVF